MPRLLNTRIRGYAPGSHEQACLVQDCCSAHDEVVELSQLSSHTLARLLQRVQLVPVLVLHCYAAGNGTLVIFVSNPGKEGLRVWGLGFRV